MKRITLALLILLFVILPVLAQDDSPTPETLNPTATAIVTATTPVPTPVPPVDSTSPLETYFPLFVVVFASLSGIGLIVLGVIVVQALPALRDNVSPTAIKEISASFVATQLHNAQQALERANTEASKTPTPFDDIAVGGAYGGVQLFISWLESQGYTVTTPDDGGVEPLDDIANLTPQV